MATALGQTWWATFLFLSLALAAALALAALLLSFLVLLLVAAATAAFATFLLAFLAGARAVALVLGAGFQFLLVGNDEDALAFVGGLLDFQGFLLGRRARRRAAGRRFRGFGLLGRG